MKSLLILLVILCGTGYACTCQSLDSQLFDSLRNKHDLLYMDKKGNFMGCGMSLECSGMKIAFYEVTLDSKHSRLKIRGIMFSGAFTTVNDTTGAVLTQIFVARPKGKRLTEIRRLDTTYYRAPKDIHNNVFPYRSGDFDIDFEFKNNDRLYFNSPLYRPLEYNIGQLLK